MELIDRASLMGLLTSSEMQRKFPAMAGAYAYEVFLDMVNLAPKVEAIPLSQHLERCNQIHMDYAPDNPYWENICRIAQKQREKGLNTYGQGLEMNPADVVARINHLEEELVDALMYCEWIKAELARATPRKEIDFDYEAEG